MRDGRAPRGFAAASIKTPGLPGGTEERLACYGVMGLPFRSGHYRALRQFPARSIGPGFRAVWHRDPHRRWTFYADAPAEVSCARYFGGQLSWRCRARADRRHLDRPPVPPGHAADVLAWEVYLAATAATRPLSSASRVRLQGTVPNGQHFQAAPRLVWAVPNSTALVGGHDIGPPGPLPTSMRRQR
jgi:hypothetical protein